MRLGHWHKASGPPSVFPHLLGGVLCGFASERARLNGDARAEDGRDAALTRWLRRGGYGGRVARGALAGGGEWKARKRRAKGL